MTVSRGHLILSDGVGRQRRERSLPRAQRQVRRIVVLGETGHVTLEAIRWCLDTGVALVQVDTRGNVLMHAGAAGRDDARLRRAQAVAICAGTTIDIARELIVDKITGQADLLRRHRLNEDAGKVDQLAELAGEAADPTALMAVEADAAARYFTAWTDTVRCRFARSEAAKVPEHWGRFINRQSLIHPGASARDAADPINALLNYGYALAEVECVLALRAVGLDPGMGVFHTDQRNRDSLALDIIEPLRPVLDDLVLQLLSRRAFTRDDFVETPNGGCRLSPLLASELAGHLVDLAPVAARYAELVAGRLAESSPHPISVTNRLTNTKRRTVEMHLPRTTAARTCKACGQPLADIERSYCPGCWETTRVGLAAEALKAGNAKLADLREQGLDPRRTTKAVASQAAGVARNRRAALDWKPTPEEEALELEWFHDELAPRLTLLSGRAIASAIGVSPRAGTRIRRGELMPHKRHWLALARLTAAAVG